VPAIALAAIFALLLLAIFGGFSLVTFFTARTASSCVGHGPRLHLVDSRGRNLSPPRRTLSILAHSLGRSSPSTEAVFSHIHFNPLPRVVAGSIGHLDC
jgi:hypothetical protein